MAETSLYKITSPSGRVYIGQSVNPRNRFLFYRRTLAPSQCKLHSSFIRYGFVNHRFKVITTVPEDQADYTEKYLIAYYNSVDTGLNIMEGGSVKWTPEMRFKQAESLRGYKHSEESKEKRRVAMLGNKNNPGGPRSEDVRKRISKSLTGFKHKDTSARIGNTNAKKK